MFGLSRKILRIGFICLLINLSVSLCNFVKAETTPEKATTIPAIDVQAIPSIDNVRREESVNIFIFISNKSETKLTNVKTFVQSDALEKVEEIVFAEIQPFAPMQKQITLKAKNNAAFTQHKIFFTTTFTWATEKQSFTSGQTTIVTIEVKRRFEEEAKGFPGGTAAFLYLLLPIIPAILGYDFVNNLVNGSGLKLPEFKSEYIVPSFLLAIIISFVMLWLFGRESGFDYSNPRNFFLVLLISAFVGACFPFGKYIWIKIQMKMWGLKENDSYEEYLRKALSNVKTDTVFNWVTTKINEESWQGLLLTQPNGEKVLGSRVQISPISQNENRRKDVRKQLEEKVFSGTKFSDKKLFDQLIKSNEIKVKPVESVKKGNANQEQPVKMTNKKEIEISTPESKSFFEFVD